MADFSDFKARYPELVSPGDANQITIEACLTEATLVLNLDACPKISDNMQMAYAAHCVSKSSDNPLGKDSNQGPATSKSVGGVSVSYSINGSKGGINDFYMSTPYGQDFLRWQRLCFGAAVLTAP